MAHPGATLLNGDMECVNMHRATTAQQVIPPQPATRGHKHKTKQEANDQAELITNESVCSETEPQHVSELVLRPFQNCRTSRTASHVLLARSHNSNGRARVGEDAIIQMGKAMIMDSLTVLLYTTTFRPKLALLANFGIDDLNIEPPMVAKSSEEVADATTWNTSNRDKARPPVRDSEPGSSGLQK